MLILFRCWKNQVPYHEATYLQSAAAKRQPTLPASVEIKWKKQSGMVKFTGLSS